MAFTCVVYGWLLPDDHDLYKNHFRSVRKITISDLLFQIRSMLLCPGINDTHSTNLVCHAVPCEINLDDDIDNSTHSKLFHRPQDCFLIHKEIGPCLRCVLFSKKAYEYQKKKTKLINTPAQTNAPLSVIHANRVTLALKEERKKNAKLTKQIKQMNEEIKSKGVELDKDLSSDINQIMSENVDNASPFMKLFWDEQKRSFGKSTKIYHPMIIRFCLSIASKSASAYDELRNSKVLTLPSRRTLRDYKNAIRPSVGFSHEIVDELIKTASNLEGVKRYVVLSLDEIKIKEELVFDKYTGELIGYIDLGL